MEATTHPEENVSFVGALLVTWISPLIKLASERQLKESDVWDCPQSYRVESYAGIVWNSWLAEKDKAKSAGRQPSIAYALFEGFKTDIIWGGVTQVLFMGSQIGLPFVIGKIGLNHTLCISVGIG